MPRLAGPDARALFAGARTATLGSTGADGRPHLVPCVFAVDGDQVYSAVDGKPKSTRQLRRLANIAARAGVVPSVLYDHFGYYAPAFGISVVFNLLNLGIVGFLVWRTGGTGRTLIWPTPQPVA